MNCGLCYSKALYNAKSLCYVCTICNAVYVKQFDAWLRPKEEKKEIKEILRSAYLLYSKKYISQDIYLGIIESKRLIELLDGE